MMTFIGHRSSLRHCAKVLILLRCGPLAYVAACGGATGAATQSDTHAGDASSGDSSNGDSLSVSNYALHFDGLNDYASSGTAQFPRGAAPQAISLWVQYFSVIGIQMFVGLHNDSGGGLELGLRNGTISAWKVYGDHIVVAAPTLPSVGVWHHVAYVFDGAISSLYVDGTLQASSGMALNVNTYVSSWFGSANGLGEFFVGNMDDVRIWSVVRSSSQVLEELRGQLPSAQPGLAAYFNCDSIDGTRVVDNSGNGNDLTLGGGDPLRTPTLVVSSVPPGK
jgi:hypothetical protein